ncbi:putative metal-binding motif-containing protein [Myxococcota bacterium]|nr:putative metal-binding motif-containing protein [Myxococcota bacterium]
MSRLLPRSAPVLPLLALLAACGDKGGEPQAPDVDQDGFDAEVDCDDADPDINPGAPEVCDGEDNDCDDLVDDQDDNVDLSGGTVYYADVDFDGYGDAATPRTACALPAGYVADDTDCDDRDEARFPGAPEVCNELDDDCDDDVDEGVGAETWYLDGDGDGFGDPMSEETACTVPAGAVAVGGDCDDEDDGVFPGATELCNGLDDDCDDDVDGEGMVALQAADGTWQDLSASFSGGGDAVPSLVLDTAGTVWFCDGTYAATFDVAADVELRGRSADATRVVLDADGQGTVVEVVADGVEVGLYDLTLTGGQGDSGALFAGGSAGGALACEVDASVTGAGLLLQRNQAGYGGALYFMGCDLSLSDSVVQSNSTSSLAGAGLLAAGDHLLDGVEVLDNRSNSDIGALYVVGSSGEVAVRATDTVFDGNSDTWTVGGIYVYDGTFELSGTTAGAAALTGNTSTYGSGAAILYPGSSTNSASFEQVDFGTEDGLDDNTLPDLSHLYWSHDYVVGDSAGFTCDQERCGRSASHTLGELSSSVSMSSRFYGNVVEADEYATIDAFSVYVGYSGGCTADLYILSTDSDPMGSTTSWTLSWSDTGNTVSSSGWLTGYGVSVLAEPGRWYTFGVGMRDCPSYDYLYYLGASGTALSFGAHVGYASYGSSYTGTFGSSTSLSASSSAVQFYMAVGATQL